MANYSGTISSGGSAQTQAAADPNRVGLLIQNISDEDMWYAFGTTATSDTPSFYLAAGDTHTYASEFRQLISQAVSIIGATTGKKFVMHDAKG